MKTPVGVLPGLARLAGGHDPGAVDASDADGRRPPPPATRTRSAPARSSSWSGCPTDHFTVKKYPSYWRKDSNGSSSPTSTASRSSPSPTTPRVTRPCSRATSTSSRPTTPTASSTSARRPRHGKVQLVEDNGAGRRVRLRDHQHARTRRMTGSAGAQAMAYATDRDAYNKVINQGDPPGRRTGRSRPSRSGTRRPTTRTTTWPRPRTSWSSSTPRSTATRRPSR